MEGLHTKVKDGLKNLAKEIATDRRKHMAEGSKQLEHLKKSIDALERVRITNWHFVFMSLYRGCDQAKKAYEKASREAEVSQQAFDKADQDFNLSRTQVDKV